MPPPKQKPVAATLFPGRRRRSSVTPAFMCATNRDGGAAPSAAIASNSSANDPVPPSSDSRSIANDEYPLAARRPATDRIESLSPRFSWITNSGSLRCGLRELCCKELDRGTGSLEGSARDAARTPGRRRGRRGTCEGSSRSRAPDRPGRHADGCAHGSCRSAPVGWPRGGGGTDRRGRAPALRAEGDPSRSSSGAGAPRGTGA